MKTLKEAFELEVGESLNDIPINGLHLHYIEWLERKLTFKYVYEETPPSNQELLVIAPDGVRHLTSWRSAYSIFTCQYKGEDSFNWKWKLLSDLHCD